MIQPIDEFKSLTSLFLSCLQLMSSLLILHWDLKWSGDIVSGSINIVSDCTPLLCENGWGEYALLIFSKLSVNIILNL